MRFTFTIGLATALGAAGLAAAACGSTDESTFNPPGQSSGSSGEGPGGFGEGGTSSGNPNGSSEDVDPTSLRVDPADAVIDLQAGASKTQAYRVLGKKKGTTAEVDLTSRAVFYVPDNFLVGGFPLDGKPTFTTRAGTADAPQRGGKLTVEATLSNSDGVVKKTTSLTVKLSATLTAGADVPANPASMFGATVDATRNPQLAYPNDGTMLPPNLRRLSVHWRPGTGGSATSLYEISFTSAVGSIVYYSRCNGAGLVAGSCGFELEEAGYGYLAETNRGQGPVKLKIRRTEDAGGGVGSSSELNLEFAESRVDGGLYYWNVTDTAVMRFDFGAPSGAPEVFADNGSCVGCHAISRDGKKLVASLNGQNNGQLVYTNDVTKAATGTFTQFNNADNRVQFASFNPDASQFVAVYGDDAAKRKLYFHDGNTGLRASNIDLPFKPDHPDWSPDGKMIAVTRVDDETTTTQMPKQTSVALLAKSGAGWAAPVPLVPYVAGLARYNPNFAPDSSFLYYTESSCALDAADGRDPNAACNADSDPSGTTWVIKPQAGATPIKLAKANTPGVADGATTNLGDTFPRSAPFQTKHRGGKLFWFTVATRRTLGLSATVGPQKLYMFAVDPAKVLAGQDGSYPGFFLPFQNLSTSNHIGQWTEKIVGGSQPPPAPPPTPPPPPPPPASPN
ncbi:MAG TPA: hypothetical protein VLT33_20305 [Labilithrix sp.]|nr:hypothetical protein [Labilithrix sp.]